MEILVVPNYCVVNWTQNKQRSHHRCKPRSHRPYLKVPHLTRSLETKTDILRMSHVFPLQSPLLVEEDRSLLLKRFLCLRKNKHVSSHIMRLPREVFWNRVPHLCGTSVVSCYASHRYPFYGSRKPLVAFGMNVPSVILSIH